MDPINKSERKKAFWNFLLLFVISIILITATVFSGRSIPFSQNTQLREEISKANEERKFSDKFSFQFNQINSMLDAMAKQNPNEAEFTDNRILESIKNLDAMVNLDSANNYNNAFYKNVVVTLKDLREARKDLVSFNGKDLNKDQLQKERDDYKQKYDEVSENLRQTRLQNDTLIRRLQK